MRWRGQYEAWRKEKPQVYAAVGGAYGRTEADRSRTRGDAREGDGGCQKQERQITLFGLRLDETDV